MSTIMNLAGSLLEDENQLVVVCEIAKNIFGFPTGSIQEVLAIPEIRPVHHAPDYVAGVFNLRGRVIVLIDPSVKLELTSQELGEESRILVLQVGSELIGILVDSLIGIFPFSHEQLTQNPENLQKVFQRMVSGFFFLDGKMVGMLKLDELLRRPEDLDIDDGDA